MTTPPTPEQTTQDPGAVGLATLTLLQTSSPSAEPVRLTLPGYEMLEVLGRGGMGVVYKARQVNLSRIVALKMLLSGDAADEGELARFQAEAEAVARLQHPNIVQIFDVGRHDGRAYFALEFVAGGTLAHKLKGTPLPPRAAAELVAELANTIQYAHERNILHRDLKPGNILLTPEGHAKIADFGLAKKLDTDDGRTRTGAIVGTPSYMAPEQAWGQSKSVGPRVDIYALGAILYECLTGRPPFRGATVMETLEQVRTREPVSVRQLNPSVPRDLETICLKCLAKEPAGRYLTARDLALDLRRFLDGEPVTARPLGTLGRLWRATRRHPSATLATVLTVVTLILGIGGGLALWLYRTSETARQTEARLRSEAVAAREQVEKEKSRAEDLAVRLERVLSFQRVQAAVRAWERADVPRARTLLDDCPVAQRGWEWHYARRLIAPWRTMTGLVGGIDSLAFLPDGRRILSGSQMDGMRVWDVATATELFQLEGTERHSDPGGGTHLVGALPITFGFLPERGEIIGSPSGPRSLDAWSLRTGKLIRSMQVGGGLPRNRVALAPDGRWLAFSIYGSNYNFARPPICLVDPIAGKDLPKMEGHRSLPKLLAASPDGALLASVGSAGDGILWDMKTFKQLRPLPEASARLSGLAFAPSGAALYACGQDGTLQCWGMPKLVVNWSVAHAPLQFTSLAVRPDGQQLACGTTTGEIVLCDAITGNRQRIYRGHESRSPSVSCLAYSPDGTRLVSGGSDSTLRVWDGTQSQEVERRQIPLAVGATVALDARGRFLITGGQNGSVRHWDLPAGHPGKEAPPGSLVTHLALAAAAPRVAIASLGCNLCVWDWQANRTILEVPNVADFVMALALSADGKRAILAGNAVDGPFLRCWNVDGGKEVPLRERPARAIVSLALSPDGTLLATRTDEGVLVVRSLPEGQERFTLRGVGYGTCLRFSADGKTLACSVPNGVRAWATESWREVLRAATRDDVMQLAFSPDGTRLATASPRPVNESAQVTIWDLVSGQEALALPESGLVTTLAFSADGQTLIAADAAGDLYFWHGGPQ